MQLFPAESPDQRCCAAGAAGEGLHEADRVRLPGIQNEQFGCSLGGIVNISLYEAKDREISLCSLTLEGECPQGLCDPGSAQLPEGGGGSPSDGGGAGGASQAREVHSASST